jgi:hypothetical protein
MVTAPPSVETVTSELSAFSSEMLPPSVRSMRTCPSEAALMAPPTVSARSSPRTPVTVTSPDAVRTDTLAPAGTAMVKSTS